MSLNCQQKQKNSIKKWWNIFRIIDWKIAYQGSSREVTNVGENEGKRKNAVKNYAQHVYRSGSWNFFNIKSSKILKLLII